MRLSCGITDRYMIVAQISDFGFLVNAIITKVHSINPVFPL